MMVGGLRTLLKIISTHLTRIKSPEHLYCGIALDVLCHMAFIFGRPELRPISQNIILLV